MDLARLLTPRDPELLRLAATVHAERADLQQAFAEPGAADYLRWLGVDGLLEYPEIARHFPPVPPEELRATACGGIAARGHLASGVDDFRLVAELFEIYAARQIGSLSSVLDFGCGCGRLLRWFGSALPDCRLFGADVRAASVRWCEQHLAGTFLTNGTAPPLELPDDAVDLTVALSVFSHLSREQNLAWMRELARVTRPDGLILVSTHGAFALAVTARSAAHQSGLKIAAAEVPALLRRLADEHFVHRRSPESAIARADGVDRDYGETFLTELFARQHWAAIADVLGCVPVAQNMFQDVHLLRPRR